MSDWLNKLTTEHVRSLKPYESARRLFSANEGQNRTWLNANEAPEAPSFNISSELLNRYPDCQPHSLIEAYAQYAQVGQNQVLATRGADEGIELLIRAFCTPGKDSVLICPPTYGMYAISARTFNVGVKSVPTQSDFSINKEQVISESGHVKLVFLCSPNNPTGTLIPQDTIRDIAKAHAKTAIVVVDEAYIEFSQEYTASKLISEFDNVVVLRTLSKAFALAGIRCGFMLSSEAIKQVLLKVIAPYPVPDPVAQIATKALSEEGLSIMQERVAFLSSELKALSESLENIKQVELVGQQCGNFVLFKSPQNSDLMQYLVSKDMLIRDQSKQINLDKCLRITVGNQEQNNQVRALIEQFFDETTITESSESK